MDPNVVGSLIIALIVILGIIWTAIGSLLIHRILTRGCSMENMRFKIKSTSAKSRGVAFTVSSAPEVVLKKATQVQDKGKTMSPRKIHSINLLFPVGSDTAVGNAECRLSSKDKISNEILDCDVASITSSTEDVFNNAASPTGKMNSNLLGQADGKHLTMNDTHATFPSDDAATISSAADDDKNVNLDNAIPTTNTKAYLAMVRNHNSLLKKYSVEKNEDPNYRPPLPSIAGRLSIEQAKQNKVKSDFEAASTYLDMHGPKKAGKANTDASKEKIADEVIRSDNFQKQPMKKRFAKHSKEQLAIQQQRRRSMSVPGFGRNFNRESAAYCTMAEVRQFRKQLKEAKEEKDSKVFAIDL